MGESRDELFVIGGCVTGSFPTDRNGRRALAMCSAQVRRHGGELVALSSAHGALVARFDGEAGEAAAAAVERATGRYARMIGADVTVVAAPVVKLF